ncbi:MAG: tripartite tricarboxylate transporter permease [Thermodesulfobacteriota bacterium]
MSGIEYLWDGFQVALAPANFLMCLVGVILGTLVGVLPGLGPIEAMAIMLPISIHYGPLAGLILLAGVWYGAQYGGSTTSILVNIPGEASSVITTIEGYQMTRKGRAGAALAVSAVGSFFAGTLGIVILQLFTPPLAAAALSFGPPEYLAIMLLAFVALSTLSGDNPFKGTLMIALGAFLSTVGIDRIAGVQRFTMGIPNMMYGIHFVPVAVGLFGIAEVIRLALKPYTPTSLKSVRFRELYPNREEIRRSIIPIIRGSFIGSLFGLLPGTPAVLASFTSYSVEKSLSPKKEEFGHGAIEGVAGPESANNSAVVLALVPLLCLGIPFAPVAALLLAGLQLHNITPGPLFIQENPSIFWGFVAAMYLGNFLLLVLNLPLVGLFARVATLRPRVLIPIIGILCLLGAYMTRMALFDVWVMIAAGIAGFFLNHLGFPLIPLILGMVLGNILEDNLRVTTQWLNGDFALLLTRPIALAILALIPIYILFIRLAGKKVLRSGIKD